MPLPWPFLATFLLLTSALPTWAMDVTPAILRIQPEPGHTVRRQVHLTAGATVLAVETACPCFQCRSPLPQASEVPLELDLTGAMPGVKTVRIHTTAGTAILTVLVAIDGAADSVGIVDHLRERHAGQHVWVLVDQPREQPRNCGCSGGSLGGIDRLAGLPALLTQAGLRPTAVVTGHLSPATAQHLVAHGWLMGHPQVAVWSGEATTPWLTPDVVAVIARQPGPQHQRMITPVPDGLLAEVLVDDEHLGIVDSYRIPIDAALPSVPLPATATAAFPPVVPDHDARSQTCATCHPGAFAAWQASRHAHAWDRLAAADRTTECAACHITPHQANTPRSDARPSAHVHCQACHLGSDAHATAPATHTTGLTDCRSCHDTSHHPAFDRPAWWALIHHGREPGPSPTR